MPTTSTSHTLFSSALLFTDAGLNCCSQSFLYPEDHQGLQPNKTGCLVRFLAAWEQLMQPVSEESNLRECPSVQMQSHVQDLCLHLWPTCPLCSTEYDALPVLSSRGRTFRLTAPLSFCIWKSAWRKRCQHLFAFRTGKSTMWQMWCYCSTLPFCVGKPNTQQMFPQQIVQIHNKWVLHFSLCLRNSSTQHVCFIFFSPSLCIRNPQTWIPTHRNWILTFSFLLFASEKCVFIFSLFPQTQVNMKC